MNERINTQDLIDLLAVRHSISKKEAEIFIKEFFLLIEQGLEADRSVKIKGLGTFKLIAIEDRESINVNTGERILIEGHTKVSFTPDNGLRDIINKPFSHFETVVLNENTILPDTPVETEPISLPEKTEITLSEEVIVEKPSSELQDSLADLPTDDSGTVREISPEPSPEMPEEATIVEEEQPQESSTESISGSPLPITAHEEVHLENEPLKGNTEDIAQEPIEEEVIVEAVVETTIEIDVTPVAENIKEEVLHEENEPSEPQETTPEKIESPARETTSFASPARKRLTAEEIIAMEIEKADEEHRRSMRIPFFSFRKKRKEEEYEEEEEIPEIVARPAERVIPTVTTPVEVTETREEPKMETLQTPVIAETSQIEEPSDNEKMPEIPVVIDTPQTPIITETSQNEESSDNEEIPEILVAIDTPQTPIIEEAPQIEESSDIDTPQTPIITEASQMEESSDDQEEPEIPVAETPEANEVSDTPEILDIPTVQVESSTPEIPVIPKATELPKQTKKKSSGSLQRYLIAVIILVVVMCGGTLLYYYAPDWLPDNTEELSADNEAEPITEIIYNIGEEPEETNNTETQKVESTPTNTAVVEQQPVVREEPAASTPIRQDPVAVATPQPSTVSSGTVTQNPLPQDIASIPVRPDSVNYVIVGTKTSHKIEEGETLTKVAYRFYGTKDLWPYIVKHNPGVIRNPNHVPFGTTIQIPELEKK